MSSEAEIIVEPGPKIELKAENGEVEEDIDIVAATTSGDPTKKNDAATVQEMLRLLDSRVSGLEQINGIPDADATSWERIRMWIIYQVNHKLSIFGTKLGCAFAILVLLINASFVTWFYVWESRKCEGVSALIDGDLPEFAYDELYRDPSNVFLCTSEFNNKIQDSYYAYEFTNEDGEEIGCPDWVPCTLSGLTSDDYDPSGGVVCPQSYSGCEPYLCQNADTGASDHPPQRVEGYDDIFDDADRPTCPVSGDYESMCQGIVSVTYYVCPQVGTLLGAALGYLFLVELIGLAVVVWGYFCITGKRYTYHDLHDDALLSDPEATWEDVATSAILSGGKRASTVRAKMKLSGSNNGDDAREQALEQPQPVIAL